VAGRLANGAPDVGWYGGRRRAHFLSRHLDRSPRAVEPPRKSQERAIAALPYAIHDAADAALERAVRPRVAREESRQLPLIPRVDDSQPVPPSVARAFQARVSRP
jgi:hypothetical protein